MMAKLVTTCGGVAKVAGLNSGPDVPTLLNDVKTGTFASLLMHFSFHVTPPAVRIRDAFP